MLRDEFIKAVNEGKTMINWEDIKIRRDPDDGAYILDGSGVYARAKYLKKNETLPTVIHFMNSMTFMDNRIEILKFSVSTEFWKVEE